MEINSKIVLHGKFQEFFTKFCLMADVKSLKLAKLREKIEKSNFFKWPSLEFCKEQKLYKKAFEYLKFKLFIKIL